MSDPINKEIIEEQAVKIVSSNLPVKHCQDFTKIASTEASFDGYVNFFEDRTKSKKEGMMPIHVQIKGTTREFDNDVVSIDVADLKNYVSSGICYFVVKMIFDDSGEDVLQYRVLAKNIIGREALDILKGKEDQETINVTLVELKEKEDYINLFKVFKYKQEMVSLHNYIDATKPSSGKITLIGEDNKFVTSPKLGDTYFATFETDGGVSFAHDFKIQWEILPLDDEIKVKERVHFKSYEKQENCDGQHFIVINESLRLEILPIGFKIDLNKNSSIDNYIPSLQFLVDAMKEKEFTIAQMAIPILNEENNQKKMISFYNNLLIFATTIRGFVRSIGYSCPFSLMDLKEKDVDSIARMYTGYEDGLVDYSLITTSLFSKMVARVMNDGVILFFDIFNPVLYSVVKFKYKGIPAKRTTPFVNFSSKQWARMDLVELIQFEDIIKNYVTLDEDVIEDYRMVVYELMIAYHETKKQMLYLYADFLNIYFHFNLDLYDCPKISMN